ncbi:hypothetical protein VTN02DRAFT_5335 [Thermoascus thermophilus]
MCSELCGGCYIIHGRCCCCCCSTDGGLIMLLERRCSRTSLGAPKVVPTAMPVSSSTAAAESERRNHRPGVHRLNTSTTEHNHASHISFFFFPKDVIMARFCSKCALLRVTGLDSVCVPLPLYSSTAWSCKCSLVSTRKAVSVRFLRYLMASLI